METTTNFTEGEILSPLIKFTIPILLAIFLQGLYGAVDLLVVGQFGDTSSVSAVATGSQIMQIITGIITELSMGVTILVGQKLGEKKVNEASKTIEGALFLFTVIAVFFTVTMITIVNPVAELMNAPAEAFDKTVNYIRICSVGIVFIAAFNVISSIFRGMGNSKLPLIFVGIACVTNIIGDLVFVGIFGLDAEGAALATVMAQGVSVLTSIMVIRKMEFPFTIQKIRFRKKEIGKIITMGFPIALQDALTNISFLIITSIINGLGLVASAAIGVSEKIVVFIMLIPIAYMSSVSAFTAQNIGACKPDRAKKALKYAMLTSLFFGAIMFFFAFWHGNILARMFSTDHRVIVACAEYMKAYAVDCILVCILFCFMGYFNGCGKTMFVMTQGILGAFLLRIPFSYFMSKVPGVTMLQIGFASPISTVFCILLCVLYYRKLMKQNTGIVNG